MQRPRLPLERLTDARLDVFAAIVGLVVSIALLPLGLFTTQILVHGVPASVGLGCLLYLLSVRNGPVWWAPTGDAVVDRLGRAFVVSRVVPRLVVVGLAGLVAIAVVSGGRPLPFLLLAGGVGSLVLAQILFAAPGTLDHRVVLGEIVAHAIVLRYAALLTTPGFISIDNWTHVTSYAAAIQESGSLSAIAGVKYYAAPVYHLLTVASAEVLSVPLRSGLYLTVAAVVALSVLVIYTAARYVVGVRAALLATMLFALADHVVRWGIDVGTTSLGHVFFLVVLLFLTRILYVEVRSTDFVLLIAFSVAIALTHQVSAFITMILLGTATAVVFLSRYVDGMTTPNEDRYLFGAFVAFVGFTAVQWAVTPWRNGTFLLEAFDRVWLWLDRYAGFFNLIEHQEVRAGGDVAGRSVSQLATYVDTTGLLLFLIVASMGSLTLLQRSRSPGTYTYVGVISVMMVFTFGLPLFGFRFLRPGRWFAFAYAPMAIVGAAGVVYFLNHFWTRTATVSLLVFLLLFPATMVLAHNATIDDPTFDEQWRKLSYTEPEIAAGETFVETVPDEREPVYTDNPYFLMLTRLNEDPSERSDEGYTYSAYLFTVSEDGQVVPEQEPVVYRTYQSEGHPEYRRFDGLLTTRQLAAEQVCPGTRNHVYATEGVIMCTSR